MNFVVFVSHGVMLVIPVARFRGGGQLPGVRSGGVWGWSGGVCEC
jgi:hypothetical protein